MPEAIVFHPQADERGNPVRLARPSSPSDQAAWNEPGRTASLIPLGELPTVLLGIPVIAWAGPPVDDAGWNAVEGQVSIDEPPFLVPVHKAAAAGVVVEEADGRLWLVSPSNQFGGYQATFPKGRVERGVNLQATAIREAFGESASR